MYFFDSIRKTILAVAKQFTDIKIERYDKNNTLLKTIQCELHYQNKSKAYLQLNNNRTSQGITLPALNLNNTEISYNLPRQQNNISQIITHNQKNNDVVKSMSSPSPITMSFELTIFTKYVSDMNKIIETIVPLFQPTKYVTVNLIPEMNISLTIPIKMTGITQNYNNELGEDADSIRFLESVITFEVESYIFPPITEKKIAKTINQYTLGSKYSITDEYSPDDAISNKIQTITDYSEDLVKNIKITKTEETYNYVHILDLTSEITTFGEKLQVVDASGVNYNIVFEYDNNEWYGNNNMIPDDVVASKTGNVAFKIPYMKENQQYEFYIKTQYKDNFQYAENVFKYYNDFYTKDYSKLILSDKKEFDYVYINGNTLNVKTTGDCIIFPNVSVNGEKTIKIKIHTFTFETEKTILGISNEQGNKLYIKTGNVNNTYNVYNENDVLQGTITSSTFNLAQITVGTSSIVFDIDGNELTVSSSDLIIPYIQSELSNLLRIDSIVII